LIFLFEVEASFSVSGRGLFVIPGLPISDPKMPSVGVGDKIQLHTPSGNVIDTYITEISHAKTEGGSKYPIQLLQGISKEDVPPGTEVWLI
jgi:hypothetical protein